MPKESEQTTIVIFSEDGKTWERFHNFEWRTMREAESESSTAAILKEISSRGMDHGKRSEKYKFELVGKEFFEQFKQPFC